VDFNQGVDLNALHDDIIAGIQTNFPQFAVVQDYPEDRKPSAVPACFIELDEMERQQDEDPGTGQQAFLTRWSARIVMGYRTPTIKRQLRILAGNLAAYIHLINWGQPGNACEVKGAYPDAFDPELDQFEVWRVEWEQLLHVGVSVYDGTAAAY
jgi:hypothetical protein